MGCSVAFKCTYCNGGENPFVGFSGACSDDIIKYNIEHGHIWCGSKNCDCRNYYNKGRIGKRPKFPCHESSLFQDWEFGAGGYQHGRKAGELIPIKNADVGKFAILTTRFPDEDRESERKIIGLYQIGEILDDNLLVANSRWKIRLPLEEAKQLYFWAYCSNSLRKPKWGSGLFRYLEDGQVHRILVDVAATVRDEKTKVKILTLIKETYGKNEAPAATGCLPIKSTNRQKTIGLVRKYGPFGEGKEHRELKEWVAAHPNKLGIPSVEKVEIERRFISGDIADIVFKHHDGTWTVVEIETMIPEPGAHQAIKYKSLLCAENRLSLNSNRVRSFLVAWTIPKEVCTFCAQYNIDVLEYRM